jgi:dihydrolipoamide dehydrogenase
VSATEIINAGVIALDAEARIDTVGDSIAAHPTLAEAFKEAALMSLDRPLHWPPAKKKAAAPA